MSSFRKRIAELLIIVMLVSLQVSLCSSGAEAASMRKFAFGLFTTYHVPGYTEVGSEAYSATTGYGWLPGAAALGLSFRTGQAYENAYRCLINSNLGARTFQVDLPNGEYYVKAVQGDATSTTGRTGLQIDRTFPSGAITPIAADISHGPYGWKTTIFPVIVSDGILQLKFSTTAGVGQYWILNNLEISTEPFLDVQGYNLNVVYNGQNLPVAAGFTNATRSFYAYGYIENTSNLPKTGSIVIAVYDNMNILQQVGYKEYSIPAHDFKRIDYAENVSAILAANIQAGWSVEALVWDGMSSMVPLNAPYIIQ